MRLLEGDWFELDFHYYNVTLYAQNFFEQVFQLCVILFITYLADFGREESRKKELQQVHSLPSIEEYNNKEYIILNDSNET